MKGKEYIPPEKRVNKLVIYVSVAGNWSQDKGEVRKMTTGCHSVMKKIF